MLADYGDIKFNTLKAIEELTELQEVLIKILTKNSKAPKREAIIDEYGDVLLRMSVILEQIFGEVDSFNLLDNRLQEKSKILINAALEGKLNSIKLE